MIAALSRSLSLRLLGIFAATALVIVIILIVQFSQGLRGQWERVLAPHMVQYIAFMQRELGEAPSLDNARRMTHRLPLAIHVYRDGRLEFSTRDAPVTLDDRGFRPLPRVAMQRLAATGIEEAAVTGRDGEGSLIIRVVARGYTVYYDFNHQPRPNAGRRHHEKEALWWSLLALALVFAASYGLIRRQLSPIGRIKQGVARMADGQFEHRIETPGQSDLDRLAGSVNDMAERIQAMLDAKRQLLLAISHELRSPLTRARLATEMLPESLNRQRLMEDLAEMETMVGEIIESERLQQRHAVLNTETLNLVQLIGSESQGFGDELELEFDMPERCEMRGDAVRLRILYRNLMSNALKHGRSDDGVAHVRVQLNCDGAEIHWQVSDEGPGIDESQRMALSEPFYRPDQSRTRATGGFGLGLNLARLVAEAHGGSLDIRNRSDGRAGAVISVRLPVEAGKTVVSER